MYNYNFTIYDIVVKSQHKKDRKTSLLIVRNILSAACYDLVCSLLKYHKHNGHCIRLQNKEVLTMVLKRISVKEPVSDT